MGKLNVNFVDQAGRKDFVYALPILLGVYLLYYIDVVLSLTLSHP